MNKTALLTLARVYRGSIIGARPGMLLLSFQDEATSITFANASGGMLIRGLERGAVNVAVQIPN